MDVIGMTGMAEAKLAREAELCFATMAIITDFDSWHEDLEVVSTTSVLENFRQTVATARQVVAAALDNFDLPRDCGCGRALEEGLMTDVSSLDASTRNAFGILLDKYE